MKKIYLAIFLYITIVAVGVSQKTLSDYTYVIVPEEFSFLDEKDEYQLNSLSKFLFNKYGFNAYFNDEVPEEVKRCDGLWAHIIGSPGFVYTRITIVLKDCYGSEVYRSEEGKSKEKNYKKAYYDAMRKAFQSVEVLGVKQNTMSNYKEENKSDVDSHLNSVTIDAKLSKVKNLPTSKYTTYSFSKEVYLLKKTNDGFSFYKESKGEGDDLLYIGKLIVNTETVEFLNDDQQMYKAHFDNLKNFIIEKEKQSIVYKLEN